MQKLHFSTEINAPAEKVWHTMLDDTTYREWTSVFNEGGYYEGSWDKGSKIKFIGPDPETGKMGGLVGMIEENRPNEYVSINYTGIVGENGEEITSGEIVDQWAGAHENYTFKEEDGKTKLDVELDTTDEFADMFNDMWPKALEKLKEMAEK